MPYLYIIGGLAALAASWQGTKDIQRWLSSDIASAPAQVAAVQLQITKAADRDMLRSIDAVVHDPNWYTFPETAAGGNLRAAYWCAIGARLGGSSVLLGYAQAYLRAAQTELSYQGDVVGNPLQTSQRGQIDRILYQAQQAAESAGRGDVAAQLAAIRRTAPEAGTLIGAFVGDEAARARTLGLTVTLGIAGAALYFLSGNADKPRKSAPRKREFKSVEAIIEERRRKWAEEDA